MKALAILLYGLYLGAVGVNGKAPDLWDYLKGDAGGYFPWLVAVAVLAALYDYPKTHELVAPFALLLVLALILHRYPDIRAQSLEIFDHYAHGAAWAGNCGQQQALTVTLPNANFSATYLRNTNHG